MAAGENFDPFAAGLTGGRREKSKKKIVTDLNISEELSNNGLSAAVVTKESGCNNRQRRKIVKVYLKKLNFLIRIFESLLAISHFLPSQALSSQSVSVF